MDYNSTHSRNNNNAPMVPPSTSSLGNQYVYNSYIDHTRLDHPSSANNALVSPMLMAQALGTRNSAGPRPMSMFDTTAAAAASSASMTSAVAAATDGNAQQLHAMTEPNTANSDRSFHAILIGETSHPQVFAQQGSNGSSSNATFGTPMRVQQST
ncbi:hypothetical protein GGI11_009313, partial [Coemansia sp. RSA 2049]